MGEKTIKLNYMGNSEPVIFTTTDEGTFSLPISQMNNLENWLGEQSDSIIIKCNDGSKIALNKYNIKYANIC